MRKQKGDTGFYVLKLSVSGAVFGFCLRSARP